MILDGKKISNEIIEEVGKKVANFKTKPKIVDIIIGEDKASNLYIKNKYNVCKKVGIDFKLINFNINTDEEKIINFIKKLNDDRKIDGIMIQLPIPDNFNSKKIINAISPSKDIDGLTDYNKLKLYDDKSLLVPCTPKGIIKILKYYNILLEDKNVVIIGRGELVGKPLIPLLLKENANVTVCHSKTSNLSKYTKNADIIICATNKINILTKDMVNSNCTVIDAGSSYKDGKIYGNATIDLINQVKNITPVPGGVGPLTVAMFLENILICYDLNNK